MNLESNERIRKTEKQLKFQGFRARLTSFGQLDLISDPNIYLLYIAKYDEKFYGRYRLNPLRPEQILE